MAYEDYNIEQFMKARFKGDFSEISELKYAIVNDEYTDTSGLYKTSDFDQIMSIKFFHNRINYIKTFVKLQQEFIKEFGFPANTQLDIMKEKYGYNLKWKNNIDDFLKSLDKVLKCEIKYVSLLESKIEDLKKSREQESKGLEELTPEESLKKERIAFIRMLNSLGKIGYKIDKKSTSVEELSLMIKQQLEEAAKAEK